MDESSVSTAGLLLLAWIGLMIGNFAWQTFGAGDFATAVERSYWQAVAMIAAGSLFWLRG